MTTKVPTRLHRPLTRDAVRSRLNIPSTYFLGRGFSAEVLDRFDVGESERLGKVVVPLYDDSEDLCIGFTFRSYKPPCGLCRKHHNPGDPCRWGQQKWRINEGFAKRSYLYNLAAAKQTDAPSIFLVEGPPDVWRLAEAGLVGVALLGTDVTNEQLRKLADLDRQVLIALDNDEPGRAATERLRGKVEDGLIEFRCDFVAIPRPHKDFGDVPVAAIREALGTRDMRIRS